MRKAVIGGTGITPFGKFLESGVRPLAERAVSDSLKDAAVGIEDVEMVFFGNAAGGLLTGQECVRGQVALRHSGLLGKPIVNVENACASSSTAFQLARMAVASGAAEIVLAIGAEKMSNDDRSKPIKALESAADLDELAELQRHIAPDGAGTGSVFMDLYASVARDYMEKCGAMAEDFARVSVKQRHAGALNPIAQFRADVDLEEVLTSRMIADPITLMMCSSIGDGAAALVVMSAEAAAKRDIRPVEILACEIRSGQGDDPEAPPVATAASRAAFESAGLGPEDLNVVELHDAAAPAEYILSEQLGL